MADSIRILGIDPGSIKTGYGLIEYSNKRNIYLTSGCIKLNAKNSLGDRLFTLSVQLEKLIEEFKPDCGGVEKIFYAKNAQSALTLGHARGVILLKLTENKLPINEYSPLQIKQTVVGVGRADKN